MSIALYLLGFLGLAGGVAMVGFGIPINEFNLGHTLIVSGTTALVGGVISIGLAAVHSQLKRIGGAQAVSHAAAPVAKPVVRAPKPAESTEPVPVSASRPNPARVQMPTRPRPETREPRISEPRVPVPEPRAQEPRFSTSDLEDEGPVERLRAAFRADAEPVADGAEEAPLSPRAPVRAAAPASPPAAAGEHFAFEPKSWSPTPGRSAAPAANARSAAKPTPRTAPAERAAGGGFFDSVWPPGRGKSASNGAHDPARGDAPRSEALPPPTAPEPVPMAILKSGVVDGMAYTLYTDGSIEAELAQGIVRFGSIEELRAHLEKSA